LLNIDNIQQVLPVVTITQDYWQSRYEMTQRSIAACLRCKPACMSCSSSASLRTVEHF